MKQVTTTITCDTCGNDLSPRHTGYPAVYILKVTVEDIARHDGMVFAVMVHPPIKHDLYFCNLNCMREYNV